MYETSALRERWGASPVREGRRNEVACERLSGWEGDEGRRMRR